MNTPMETEPSLEQSVEQLRAELRQAVRRARVAAGLGLAALCGSVLSTAHPVALAQSPGVSLASLLSRLSAVETKVATLQGTPVPGPQGPAGPGFTPDKIAILNTMTLSNGIGKNTELTIKGVNVHIVDGNPYGLTDDGTQGESNNLALTGLGNLIIGYNGGGSNFGDFRTGSHNLVLGDQNDYGSYGGLIAGQDNSIGAPYACVTGGSGNRAYAVGSSIAGGVANITFGMDSVVSGGQSNTAIGTYATVSGGYSAGTATTDGWTAGVNGAQVSTYSGNFASP